MRIACPSCETAYDVPESVLTPGRVMRCALCRREWAPKPATPEPAAETAAPDRPAMAVAPPPPPDDDPLPFLRPPEPPSPAARPAVLLGWTLSVVLLGLFAWSAIVWREPVMRHWPPAARLYAALGYRR